jgi:hypothetical protein
MAISLLDEAISRLSIPVLWVRLNLPGKVREHCTVRSPLRDDDRKPSFSIYARGTRWLDHSTEEGGDSFDFFCAVLRLDKRAAYPRFLAMAGLSKDRPNRWIRRR